MRVFNYCRKSVFSESSDSIRNQSRMCREYVESRFPVDSWIEFSDEDYSGSNTERPGLQRMLDLIEADQCDLLIVYALDRLSRNVRDFSNIYATLENHHVKFVCLDRNIDTSTPIGEAMMYISATFAQMERKTIAARITDNMIGLAKVGLWVGGNPPIGYDRTPVTLNGRKHVTIIPNDKADFVRALFDDFLEGDFTLSGFETHCRKNGISAPRGGVFSSTQLWQILRSPFYCPAAPEVYDYFAAKQCIMESPRDLWTGQSGVSVYGRTTEKNGRHQKVPASEWRVMVGLHEPIITVDKWLAVQKQLSKHVYSRKKKYPPALLIGSLRCKCGWKMAVQHKKKQDGVSSWYHCTKRDRQGAEACDMQFVRTEVLDGKVRKIFHDISLDPDLIQNYRHVDKPKKPPVRKINEVEKKIKKLTDSLAVSSGSAATKYIIAEIDRLDQELTSLRQEAAESLIESKPPKLPDLTGFEDLDPEEQNEIVRKTVTELTWDGETLTLLF